MSFGCMSIDADGLPSAGVTAMNSNVDNSYVKSVVKGLTVSHICLGIAATAAVITVVTVGWTQLEFLVSWVPVIFTAVFLVVTTILLQKDVVQRQKQQVSKNR
jgi:hypothetical protein